MEKIKREYLICKRPHGIIAHIEAYTNKEAIEIFKKDNPDFDFTGWKAISNGIIKSHSNLCALCDGVPCHKDCEDCNKIKGE